MGKKYKNSPIVEALCEFQFIPSHPWDMTIPGLFYEKIRNDFPEKKQQMGFGVGFQPKEKSVEQKIEMNQRIQFLRTDKTALVQVAADLLVINHLKPYPTWDIFKPILFKNLDLYKEIANPKGFKRIGLRYINKIDIPSESIEMSEYFNFYPPIPKDLPQIHSDFNMQVEIPYENERDRLLLTLTKGKAIPEKSDIISIILGLYHVMVIPEKVSFDEVEEWTEKAHTIIEKAFESCITDKCRTLFEEEE